MARNRYPGNCYCCGTYVPVGFGHFERHNHGWRIKCVKCASGRTVHETDKEVQRAIKLSKQAKEDSDMNQDFYLLIAGSRKYDDYQELSKVCDFLLAHQIKMRRRIIVVSGGAKGADTLAERYAVERKFDRQIFHADWEKYGKSAGFRRNEQMHRFIEQFTNRACVCFWDGQSKGTQHNFSLCEKGRTPLRIWNYVTKTYMTLKA